VRNMLTLKAAIISIIVAQTATSFNIRRSFHGQSRVTSLNSSPKDSNWSAKLQLSKIASIAVASLIGSLVSSTIPLFSDSSAVAAVTTNSAADAPLSVYFGVGCFWHVQHEFVAAEKLLLGRTDDQITAKAGYAGGTKSFKDNAGNDLVCYHNLQGQGDYGRLGYSEAVQVTLPSSDPAKYREFADAYFALFGADGERPDKGDRGPEYRSVVGLPGGLSDGPLSQQLQQAASSHGISLKAGRGDDPDTLFQRTVWVMDSAAFPFRQAELYHQFHDGFMPGEQYPESYNQQVQGAYKRGELRTTGCPDRAPPS